MGSSKQLLIVVSGAPCTGMTTLGRRIAHEFLPLVGAGMSGLLHKELRTLMMVIEGG